MKTSQTIFCKDDGTVTISVSEYNKLIQYKELCKEFQEVLSGDDSWALLTDSNHQHSLN